MNKSEDLSGVYKIVIVDDSHIGKSQFLNMFIKKKTFNKDISPTIEVDFRVKK